MCMYVQHIHVCIQRKTMKEKKKSNRKTEEHVFILYVTKRNLNMMNK